MQNYKNNSLFCILCYKGNCEDYVSVGIFSEERVVTIKKGIKSDLLIDMGGSVPIDLEAFEENDSMFIPSQSWQNFDGTQAFFKGEGKIINDSLFLHYQAGGSFGQIECNCKGKKIE